MTEPDQIEFREHLGGPEARQPGGSSSRSIAVRIGIVAGSALLFVIGAVAAMGASPSPSGATASPDTGVTPVNPATPGRPFDGMPFGGAMPRMGMMGPGLDLKGGVRFGGFGDITITAISGSNVSLKTDDGWTRTIAVGSSTTITKGGQTIALGDLKVGDQIVFGETRASDGSYTINQIHVVLPVIGGQVTAVGSDSITVDQRDGTSATIHVSSATTYDVNGNASAKLSDITAGSFVVAEGTLRSDGSLDATAVHAGTRMGRGPGGFGPMFRGGWNDNDQDQPGAAPSATPSTSSSAS